MKKICVFTGTRAEYGLLKPLIRKIKEDDELTLQLIVSGSHLSPEFGMTINEIKNDGFEINEKIEMILSSDSSVGIIKSMGVGLIGYADALERLKPDLIIILGDRYEALAIATSAMIARIPIAHIHGGEITEGAYDDSIRHAITKMSYIHFSSTNEYRNRIIQMGEEPERVYNVGAIGLDSIFSLDLLKREELIEHISFDIQDKYFLVTYHPTTLEERSSEEQFHNLLKALDMFKEYKVVFTKANADTDGRIINEMIDEYVAKNKQRCVQFTSMGQLRYLSAMKYCTLVIGNSSSGILEAPSFNVPTVNIGNRQKGRIAAESVFDCNVEYEDIVNTINNSLEFKSENNKIINPYYNGNTTDKILSIIKNYVLNNKIENMKKFFDLDVNRASK
ncbi:UDP-N-acetylglucosamine 2-epimerase [Clostridium sp. 'White wine YQ']|uniref:UDP-N-acetylglucosamine 2-epimerase n=1 Tax=Clostridium sp. 'White wine YQ' TaxID=3027474 RepID=UPI002365DE44|nr:UDP-N-acetylglucosamine 2-epimerase [Clostridium sp. 'White wine YQ']MDD7794611.1 UDP-N-acetylglucosamine 2-epimerase [Clostridium sp. 'White wine YQ']